MKTGLRSTGVDDGFSAQDIAGRATETTRAVMARARPRRLRIERRAGLAAQLVVEAGRGAA